MKKIKTFLKKISHWVDVNCGYYLTNPNNLERWRKRHNKK